MKDKSYLKILLIFFSFFFHEILLFSETREVPNIIIKDNPKKEVYQIDTLKRRTKPAELNLTITKIKSKELKMKIDERRKLIFADIDRLNSGEEIYVTEKIDEMPNSSTSRGRRALNLMKKSNNINLKLYEARNRNNKVNKEILKISYDKKPQELYVGVLNSKNELKSLYKSTFTNYDLPKNNTVNLKVWLFTEELDKKTNLIFVPGNNGNGNLKIRSNRNYSVPEDAVEQIKDYLSVFDMTGTPVEYSFEDDDKIEVQGTSLSGIKNSQGSFYKDRNKYAEFTASGFNIQGRIWSDFSGIEISLEKKSPQDNYVTFKILHKSSNGDIIQTINVELFINTKNFKEYFVYKEYSKIITFDKGNLNDYMNVDIDVKVKGLITDSLNIEEENPHTVYRRIGDTGKQQEFESNYPMIVKKSSGFGNAKNYRINAGITKTSMYISYDWLDDYSYAQFFYSYGINMAYGNGKRKIPVRTEIGLYDGNWKESTEVIEGSIIGLPILEEELTSKNINGYETVYFKGEAKPFKFVLYDTADYIYLKINDKKEKPISDSDILEVDGMSFGIKYKFSANKYSDYYLILKDMKLRNKDRKIILKGKTKVGDSRKTIKQNIIHIPKFEADMLVNKVASSIRKNILVYEDVSEKFIQNSGRKIIELGTVYFYQLDTEILSRNCNTNPSINLAKSVYLEAIEDVPNKKILAELSYDKKNSRKKLELNISEKKAGGDGEEVFLILEQENYEKFIKNGGGVTYNLKTENGEKICHANVTADKNSPKIEFETGLIEQVTVKTREVNPSIGEIIFSKDKAILKDTEIQTLNSSLSYVNPPSGYDYNSGLQMNGKIDEYNYKMGKHNIEIRCSNETIESIIGTSGTGFWKNLDVSDGNLINLAYKKNDKKTYISLRRWNYESVKGFIIIKHYVKGTENVGQFYKIKINLPQLDPYIYYNESYNEKTIKKGEVIQRKITKKDNNNLIELGYVSLNNCDMRITIQNDGNKKDEKGMRIEKNSGELEIIDTRTMAPIEGKKAKIKLEYENNGKIASREIIGANKYAKVMLEIPNDLPRHGSYEIKSKVGKDILFNNNQSGYILRIGRNGYWKELISKIELKGVEKVEGKAELEISDNYKENSEITFEGITYDNLKSAELKNPVPVGVSLNNKEGYGILKAIVGDKAFITYSGQKISLGIVDSSGNSEKKKVILDNGNEIEVQFRNGEFIINLQKKKLGVDSEEKINIQLIRDGEEALDFELKMFILKSWFRILKNDGLDFGDVIVGSKNLMAKSFIELEGSSSLDFNNIKVKMSDYKVPLYLGTNSAIKDLDAQITYLNLVRSGNNRYKIDVEGKIDTQDDTKIGNQKGIAEIIIEIKE